MYFYTSINLQSIEINTLFTGHNSTNFFVKIIKRMDKTLGSSVVHKAVNASNSRNKDKHNLEKLVLKFTRCNFDV